MILVHPPHVALIVRAQVKTDTRAALAQAQLHAKGLLPAVWVPPVPVREQRATVAQRAKFTRLATQAKNRLHAALHRHHRLLPEGDPFGPANTCGCACSAVASAAFYRERVNRLVG